MSHSDKKSTKLASQQTAVMSYLEDLLLEVPPLMPDLPDNVKAFPKPVSDAPAKLKNPVVDQPVNEVEEAPAVEEPVKLVEHKESGASTTPEAETQTAPLADLRPSWAEQEFQCLMFNVVGISLAVPLVKLNGVIPWTDDLTPMPGHSEAFLGLLRHLGKNVKVMDTATVILPPQQRQQLAPVEERMKKIILMDEGRWGLACDDVGEVITLQAEEVRWRTAAGRRPWLAGTIPDRLCALLDTEVLANQLADG
jgi:purine-binding chemotaxis protein CheW